MATETKPEKKLGVMMKNLKIDPSSEASSTNMAAFKDSTPSDATSCISSAGDTTSSIKENEMDHESRLPEQGMYYSAEGYYGYYYPGFDGSFGECDDQGNFLGTDHLEIQYPAIQSDNGSVFYYPAGLQHAYSPYNPYFPGAVIGMDPQYFGQQPLFSNPGVAQPLATPGYYPSPVPYGAEVLPVYPWDTFPVLVDSAHGNYGNGFQGGHAIPGAKSISPPHSLPSRSAPSSKSSNCMEKESSPVLGMPPTNPPLKPPAKHGSGFPAATVFAKGYFPLPKFQAKGGGLLYPSGPINGKTNERSWLGSEKQKPRGKFNGINDLDLLNEQNRGPRTNGAKPVAVPDTFESDNSHTNVIATSIIKRDQYNLPDFPTKYEHALFYVIKSYSEDDIHKSIKYSVWASTPNGNKRLDAAFQEAQSKGEEKSSKCPVFLFFSVNASGQFCGVAEMAGRVDFSKNMDFWQQDKWNGFFPVKWHIIKDVPNPQFRHILLENNDNKPVTNSRDTQEIKFSQGIEMLNIFKNYSAKTSILDDFGFYESRQKAMQDQRSRPVTPHREHFQKKADEINQVAKPAGTGQFPSGIPTVKKIDEPVEVGSEAKK